MWIAPGTLWNALTDFMLLHLSWLGHKGFALKTENSKDEGWYKNQWGFSKATRQKQHLSLQLNKSTPGFQEWHIVGALDSTESITGSIEQHDTIPWWKMGRGLGVTLCRVFEMFTITQSKKIHNPWAHFLNASEVQIQTEQMGNRWKPHLKYSILSKGRI